MQMCPNCGNVYDESEYAKCPNCHPSDDYKISEEDQRKIDEWWDNRLTVEKYMNSKNK